MAFGIWPTNHAGALVFVVESAHDERDSDGDCTILRILRCCGATEAEAVVVVPVRRVVVVAVRRAAIVGIVVVTATALHAV